VHFKEESLYTFVFTVLWGNSVTWLYNKVLRNVRKIFNLTIFRPYYENVDKNCSTYACFQDFSYVWNGWWIIAVTMTTVGFGDYFP
jgi:hypothetical protein